MADFPTSIRILDVDSLATVFDFHDPDDGYEIGAEVTLPLPNKRQGRLKVARAIGSFPVGARLPDDGTLVVPVVISGRHVGAAADPVRRHVRGASTALTSSTSRRCCRV